MLWCDASFSSYVHLYGCMYTCICVCIFEDAINMLQTLEIPLIRLLFVKETNEECCCNTLITKNHEKLEF